MAKKGDVLAIVEAAYRVDVEDDAWLHGVASACFSELDRGLGICVFEFKHQAGVPPECLQMTTLGMGEELSTSYPTIYAAMAPDLRMRPFSHGPCTTGSQMMGAGEAFEQNPQMRRFAHKFGIFDSVWITAAEPSGWGCGVHAGRPEITRIAADFRARWGRIAAHLSAASRLRRRLRTARAVNAEGASAIEEAEAVFTPDGGLQHAQGAAREGAARNALRQAVLALEVARSRRASEDAMSIEDWKGLVSGRWSLLDRFERDGRRYVVAQENMPYAPGPDALSTRETQVLGYAALGHHNKLIAYDLGISHSTVRVLMARAASKLGARSREEAVERFRALSSAGGRYCAAADESCATESSCAAK